MSRNRVMVKVVEEPWLVPHIKKAARDRGIAIDVGANVGLMSSLMSELFDGVVAVEPDPRAFADLLADAPENVLCQHAAATSINGTAELLMRPESVQSSLLDVHPVGAGGQAEAPVVERVSVNAVTLDALLFAAQHRFGEKPVTFIKIDVEGSEGDVLAGATDPLFRKVRWLVEVHDRRVEVGTQLKRLGYSRIEVIKHPYASAHSEHFWVYLEPPEHEAT